VKTLVLRHAIHSQILKAKIHELRLEGQNSEAVLKENPSHKRHSVHPDEHTKSRLRNDCGTHDELFDSVPEFPRENTKDKNKGSAPRLLREELDGASRDKRKFSQQVDMIQNATNALSDLIPSTNSAPHLWQHLTELEVYVKGRSPLLCD
jgi:hypothetical protein